MEKEEFEKKKSKIVKNGLNIIKGLEETFVALLKYDWYGEWKYPDEFRNLNGSELDPVDFQFLFKRIRTFISTINNNKQY